MGGVVGCGVCVWWWGAVSVGWGWGWVGWRWGVVGVGVGGRVHSAVCRSSWSRGWSGWSRMRGDRDRGKGAMVLCLSLYSTLVCRARCASD